MNKLTPKYSYLQAKDFVKGDNVRLLRYQGKECYHATSIHKKFEIPKHNINNNKGSFAIWLLPLEDLATVSNQVHIVEVDPFYANYAILSDCAETKNFARSTFCFNWASDWYPQLCVKCHEGIIYADEAGQNGHFTPRVQGSKPFSAAGRFPIKKAHWYQLGVCWDKEANILNIYANGVLVAASNSGFKMQWEEAGEVLYTGNTAWGICDLNFYEDCLSGEDFVQLYENEKSCEDEELQNELLKTYTGAGLKQVEFQPDSDWVCKLNLPLTQEPDLNSFYVQGCIHSPKITKDGLWIKTNTDENYVPRYELDGELMDENHVYLWTKQAFEGDLYVEFEFMPKQHNGFSLIMLQASGMQREDFMKDYKLRKTSTMKMVCWENVRSYNWGYFREMDDVRDDVSSHLIMKNPWLRPLQYQCKKERIQLDRWYKLQFIQEGNHIRGIFDGDLVFDFEDNGFTNSGPVYNCGHFALRCMLRTEALYRNLKIYNKEPFFKVIE